MSKLHYYVALYHDQYVPETSFHGVYAHEQKVNFKKEWKDIIATVEKNFANDEFEVFQEEMEKELAKRGFLALDIQGYATFGPSDKNTPYFETYDD